ncbi:MAG: hypothetical protein IJ391_08230 [Clostridia bacterium]|nr:hypothetical protein [Clostridia bacterium]
MEEYSLEGIRHDSIRRVFACIPKKGQISRHEISGMTGLSLMTVGKITDTLLEKGVVTYAKSDSHSVGRKARHISLAHEKHILVLELDGGSVRASFADTSLCERFSFTYQQDRQGTDLTDGFMGELMPFIFENGLVGTLVGVGITYDGADGLVLAQQLADVCKNMLSLSILCVSESLCAKVRAASEGKKVLYFVRSDGGVRAAVYKNSVECGSPIRADNEHDMGIAVRAVINFVLPDKVCFEFENNFDFKNAVTVGKEKASMLARIGISEAVREAYLLT